MAKLFYPAVFHEAEEGGFWITFPDFPECFSQGENMEEAYEMAVDALKLCISNIEKEKISKITKRVILPKYIEAPIYKGDLK